MVILKHTVFILGTQLFAFLLRLGTNVMVARALGLSAFGVFSVVIAFHYLAMGLSNLGLGYSNSYSIAKGKADVNVLHSHSVIMAAGLGIISLLIYWLAGPPLVRYFFREVEPSYALLAIMAIPFALYASFVSGIWIGMERISLVNSVDRFRAAATFVLTGVGLGLFGRDVGLVLKAWLAANVATALFTWIKVRREHAPRFSVNPGSLRDMLKFGSTLHLGNLGSIVHLKFDIFAVNYFLGAGAAGIYSLAAGIGEQLWSIPAVVLRAASARLIGTSCDDSWSLTSTISRYTVQLAAGASAFLFFAAPYLVGILYGAIYLPAVEPLRILLPGIMANGIGLVLSHYFTGNLGRPDVLTVRAWVAVLVNVLLCLILIPAIGLRGAALSTTFSYFLAALLLVIYANSLGRRASDLLVIRKDDLRAYQSLLLLVKSWPART